MAETVQQSLIAYLRRHISAVQATLDGLAWAAALVGGTALRYDFMLQKAPLGGFALIIPLAILCQVVAGLLDGLYMGRSRYGSFEEVAGMVRSAVLTTVVVFGLNAFLFGKVVLPRGALIIAGGLAVLEMAALRYGWRLLLEHRRRTRHETAERVAVFGAGEGAVQAIAAMQRDPDASYKPVVLLDDNPAKGNLKIMGVPVVGTRDALAATVHRHRCSTLLIAIPSAEGPLISELTSAGEALGLTVLVLPPVKDLFGSPVTVTDLREVSESDLLGRHRIETDMEAIAGYLTNRRILVTGAGGSIGSELCRQLHRFDVAELIMLDRDESALHAVQLSIEGQALLDSSDLILLDIRDRDRIEEVFRERQPEVVFHAAALKHLTLLEKNPAEAIKTNVFGSLHLLEIAAASGVECFVNVSTDKAADPSSVLGYSKRIVERLTSWYAHETDRAFLSVRFGNVLGSRGSVLGTFRAQIARGGPITVTSREASRFFMTVEEAVQLVIQAGAIGKPGETLVLDMGQPVCIAEIAQLLVNRAGNQIPITYTGLRPGEKLHEVLLGAGEADVRPTHPLISHVPVPPLDPAALDVLVSDHRHPANALADLSTRPVVPGSGASSTTPAGAGEAWPAHLQP